MDNVDNLSVAHSIFNCTEKPRTCVAKMNPPFAIGLLHKKWPAALYYLRSEANCHVLPTNKQSLFKLIMEWLEQWSREQLNTFRKGHLRKKDKCITYLSFEDLNKRVNETQFPSIWPPDLTVGVMPDRQEKYNAHVSQWSRSPWNTFGPWADFKNGVYISSWLPPFLHRFFCRLLWFSIPIFYFNLFPASVSVCLAWKQHVLMVLYGMEFDVLKFLSKTYFRIWRKTP